MAMNRTYPLTTQQYNIWLSIQIEPTRSFKWNLVNERVFKGVCDIAILKNAWQQVIDANEALQYSFATRYNIPYQVVNTNTRENDHFRYLEFTDYTSEQSVRETDRIFHEELYFNSSLENDLYKLTVIKLSDDIFHFILRCHHIVADGRSLKIMLEDLGRKYSDLLLKTTEQAVHRNPYSVYINYQQTHSEKNSEKISAYWAGVFCPVPPRQTLPYDFINETCSDSGASETISYDLIALRSFALRSRSTLSSVLLSAFYLVLRKYLCQNDIIIGTYFQGRTEMPEFDQMIGMFVNVVGLRINVDDSATLRQLYNHVFLVYRSAFDHQNITLQELRSFISRESNNDRVFDVAFNYSVEETSIDFSRMELISSPIRNIEYIDNDLQLRVYELKDNLHIRLDFNSSKFNRSTARRILNNLISTLDNIQVKATLNVGDVQVLCPQEQLTLQTFSYKAADYPDNENIIKTIEEYSLRFANEIAIRYLNENVSYGILNLKANFLSGILAEKGVKKGSHVAVMINHTPELVISILAILKLGAVYIPIDMDWPKERQNEILTDLKAAVLLVGNTGAQSYQNFPAIKCIQVDYNDIGLNAVNPILHSLCEDPVYIIYTSGSTGKPKGVIIPRRGLTNRLLWMNDFFGRKAAQSVLVTTRFVYDSSVWQILWPLINGGSTVLIPTKPFLLPNEVLSVIKQYQITTVDFVPSLFSFVYKQINLNDDQALKSVHCVILGGEEIVRTAIVGFKRMYPEIRAFNLYGPTEASIGCIAYEIEGNEAAKIPIGKPISNTRVLIIDDLGQVVPIGVVGQIYLGGKCVGLGYLNDEIQTAQSFVLLPSLGHDLFYKTGDYGRWLENGNIEFLGRKDQQIKIRGHRVELGEIRACLLAHENISECVITVIDKVNNPSLCAYIVEKRPIDIRLLKIYLASKLNSYSIPSHIIPIDSIPLTDAGKINYSLLPVAAISEPSNQIISRLSDIEKEIAIIWSELLKIDYNGIGREENFFESGGNSLTAIGLLMEIYKKYDIEVSLYEFFKSPTISFLNTAIERKATPISFEKFDNKGPYLLSPNQTRMFVLHHIGDGGILYNMPSFFTITGNLDKVRVNVIFQKLINRHESLRTFFTLKNRQVVQEIHKGVPFKPVFKEISEDCVQVELSSFIQPFDLLKYPLIRVAIYGIGNNRHILAIDSHHIIADGISIKTIMEEFCHLYEEKELPEVKFRYEEYVNWLNTPAQQQLAREKLTYWIAQFAGTIPVLQLPLDFKRPALQKFEGESVQMEIRAELLQKLNRFLKEEAVTLFTILFSGFTLLLAKLSGQADIIIGVPVSGRTHPALQRIVGLFANTLAIRTFPKPDKSIVDYVHEIKATVIDAFNHQDFSLNELIDTLGIARDLSRNPVYDVVFSYQEEYTDHLPITEINIKRYDEPVFNAAKVDLTFWCSHADDGISIKIEYNKSLFKRVRIKEWAHLYEDVLEGMIANRHNEICKL